MSGLKEFEHEFLQAHNEYRHQHGAPPLKLSRKLCDLATNWANTIAANNNMQHNPNRGKNGENIYWASGMPVDGKQPVKNWYDEIKDYNFQRSGFSSSTGHFTQVIWHGSQEIGVGVAKRGNSTWIVANYYPAGNMMGDYQANVKPKCRN